MLRRLDHAPSRRFPFYSAAIACLVAACGGGDLSLPNGSQGGDIAIRVVEGNNQRGSVGRLLEAPVVVRVTDDQDDPVEGVTVEFALTSAGEGSGITPETALTNSDGRAEAQVLLGDKVGVQTGEARVVGDGDILPTATFSALAEAADNRAPIADFGWSCEDLTCRFSEASTDNDGSVTAWAWRFGDGSTSEEREPTHSYAAAGTYTVRLTVTDDQGARDELADEVRVTDPATPPSNQAPRADFDVACRNLTCDFTDRSEDEDGRIESRHWDFGDGATSTGRNPSHRYESAGRYEVILTVTDDDGAEDSRTGSADPAAPDPPPLPPEPPPPAPEPNDPPEAQFDVSCQNLSCSFVDRSEDGDGSIVGWRWNFGDGANSTDRSPSHTYGAPGRYDVVLTVTDDDGTTDAMRRTAEPQAPPPPPPPPPANDPPVAEFQVSCQELSCTFVDRSTDRDGSVVSWQWNFGDGTTSTERNPSHTYSGPGRFDVLLMVTDDDGAAATRTHRAEPHAPPPPEPNRPPEADFDVRCDHLTCTFTDKSKDDDGSITSWQWSFGDGTTSAEQNPVHVFAERGRYEVLLTVTDDEGASDTRNKRADPKD
jgi:PKD repeat protein